MSDNLDSKEHVIKREATRIGFDLVGIADAVATEGFAHFSDWLDAGFDGEMNYLARRKDAYQHPKGVMENVRSVVMLGMNYKTEEPKPCQSGSAKISRYAWGTEDYHDVIRNRLKELANVVHHEFPGCQTRAVVDTAPLLERDFAKRAGLGWFGKNTMLINKRKGSFFFLAGLLTDVSLKPDQPHATSHCGTCTRCLEACPTDAFAEPYVLDARKCISYLSIELRNQPIPKELRNGMQDWLFGCDVCQDVCPWNRKSPQTEAVEFQPTAHQNPADVVEILRFTDEQFKTRFGKTPLSRPGRIGIIRNAAIIAGNQKLKTAEPELIRLLTDPSPVIRGACVWALGEIGTNSSYAAVQDHQMKETEPQVLEEIKTVLQ